MAVVQWPPVVSAAAVVATLGPSDCRLTAAGGWPLVGRVAVAVVDHSAWPYILAADPYPFSYEEWVGMSAPSQVYC